MARRSYTTPLTKRTTRTLAAGALGLVIFAFVLVPPSSGQVSGIGLAITPAFQTPLIVGQQNQPAIVQLVNNSVGVQAAVETVTVTNIRLNPGCATSAVVGGAGAPSPCTTLEPRPVPAQPILDLDDASTAGTTCPGGPFAITGPDAEGDYAFTPTGAVTLAPVGQPGASCRIEFTFDVIQAPNDGQTFQSASLVATSLTFPGGVPQTGVSHVSISLPPTTTTTTTTTTPAPTVAPATTTTTVRVAVLPGVVTTTPSRGALAATGADDLLVPGLGLLLVGFLGLVALRRARNG